MLRIGIVGFGFMGRTHFTNWHKVPNAKIVAVWDFDCDKLQVEKTSGNIGKGSESINLTDVDIYSDCTAMLNQAKLHAVSVAVPTFMHLDFCRKAFEAGVDVLCEKPMALDSSQCDELIASANRYNRKLMIAHCIRFWPEYAKAKEIVDLGLYGRVLVANFKRFCETPQWSLYNWLLDNTKSGGAILDFHIHDTDFVQYLFGIPESVYSCGVVGVSGGYDHIMTNYNYDKCLVTAEGGWLMAPGFGFEMSFNIILEKATIIYNCNNHPTLQIYPIKGLPFVPDVKHGNGYSEEIAHFVDIVTGNKVPSQITLQDAKNSVKIIEAERTSARTEKVVFIQS